MHKPSDAIRTFILTLMVAVLVIGGSLLLQQRNSIQTLKNEVATLKTGNNPVVAPTAGKDHVLPEGVDWLIYVDSDIAFPYPETFIDSTYHEDSDINSRGAQWSVSRREDVVSIRPNFESPASEFGATYEIKIIKSPIEAAAFTKSITENAEGPKNLCQPVNNVALPTYSLCVHERDTDEGLGRVGRYYIFLPSTVSGKPVGPTLALFDASGGMYTNYIRGVLIPELKIK